VPVTNSIRSDQAQAEVLLWQNGYRLLFIAGASVVTVALRMAGVLRPSSVLSAFGGARAHVAFGLGAVALYMAAIALLDLRLRRSGRAGRGVVAAVAVADVLVASAVVLLVTPPQYYERALVVAFFSLQLVLLYFGRAAAVVSLGTVVVAYAGLVALARASGAPLLWSEELWTLTLFAAGSGIFINLQGDVNRRLTRIVRMFERAEEGDFTMAYDVVADRRPDSITLVGHAYDRMRTRLATIALIDPLSGCLNRRGFEQQLAREASRAARTGADLALIAVDVDHFKLVNDTFGHLAGDAAIREVGELLRENARAGDVVARIGGEEFMILAPATNVAGAYHLATRMLDAFRKRSFAAVQGRIPITASFGVVADRVRDEHVVHALRSRADEALYAAKRGGRNRVTVWSEGGVGTGAEARR
jgi:diguanylate cyclase (GGDEF)-like protein